MGLLMTAIPLTASAHDKATCSNEPGWGYQHPNWYQSWWQKNCGSPYGYNQNYFGSGQNYFGNGGRLPFAPAYSQAAPGYSQYAPAYSQYQGPRYYNNGWRNKYRANGAHSWRERLFHHDHHEHR